MRQVTIDVCAFRLTPQSMLALNIILMHACDPVACVTRAQSSQACATITIMLAVNER